MDETTPPPGSETGSQGPRNKSRVVVIVLAVLVFAGVAAFVALGGLGLIPGSQERAAQAENEQVEAALLKELQTAYGQEITGVVVQVDESSTVGVEVRTGLAADTELVPQALQIAGETAALESLRREWPDGVIVVKVWPGTGDMPMTGAVAKVRAGALASPVRPYVEESFRPGAGTQ